MNEQYIDLHLHSTFSDGSFTPAELVEMAVSKNLSTIALTDHDTTLGIGEAIDAADRLNLVAGQRIISVIPGIELSAEYNGQDIHILGLNIDYTNPVFLEKIDEFRKTRESRNEKMIKKMQDEGFNFTEEQIKKRFGDAVITRAHYAILMVEGGYVPDKDTAFEKYLNPGCSCYIPRFKVSVQDAVRLIRLADGYPVLAHPLLYKLTYTQIEELINILIPQGLMGIEAYYSCNKNDDTERMTKLAHKYGLFITGGSDFHGTAKPGLEMGTGYGDLCVPEELLLKFPKN